MKVLIADDHKVVRIGLSILVGDEFPHAEILQASNGADVLEVVRREKLDLMLMDVKMPDTDSLMMMEQVLTLQPQLPILVISLNPEKIYAVRYLKSGASGYVQKSEDDVVIRAALRKVMHGKKYMSDEVIEVMTELLKDGSSADPFSRLGKREFDVAVHLIRGLSPGEIGEQMSLQPSTVSTYKVRIFEKLNIENVHDLVELAKQYDVA